VPTYKNLMAQACEQTGLDNFGDDSFREGLEMLVRALRDEARLNATGEAFIYPRIVGHLANRLQVEDWYQRHPDTDEVPIARPLFGVGLPRTGSTALSYLLSRDPDIRYLRHWESPQPCPPPSTVVGEDPRIARFETEHAGARSHEIADSRGPMECLDLMALDFKSNIFLAFGRIPSYQQWLLEADLTSTYLYERRVLKLLQWGEPAKPWRLKTPAHIFYLPYLNRAFPDARFVMTHRDPTDVMLSNAQLIAGMVEQFSDHVDYCEIGQSNVSLWATGIQRALEFRDAGEDQRFYDIDFRAMQTDPIGEIRGLYDWLDEPISEEFETTMRQWWRDNSENRQPSKRDDPAKYGLDSDRIRPLFADYVARAEVWTRH